jgi:hypothetical protein
MLLSFDCPQSVVFALSTHYNELVNTAKKRQSAQTKTASEEAAIEYLLYSYTFFLLATPIKPIRPEPNSQTAAGTGIGLTVTLPPIKVGFTSMSPAESAHFLSEPLSNKPIVTSVGDTKGFAVGFVARKVSVAISKLANVVPLKLVTSAFVHVPAAISTMPGVPNIWSPENVRAELCRVRIAGSQARLKPPPRVPPEPTVKSVPMIEILKTSPVSTVGEDGLTVIVAALMSVEKTKIVVISAIDLIFIFPSCFVNLFVIATKYCFRNSMMQ